MATIHGTQRTVEWFNERLGRCTASRVADVVALGRGGVRISRARYAAELAAERATGRLQRITQRTAAIEWGIRNEAPALRAYETKQSVKVHRVCFVTHPTIQMAGASPDGLIGDDGLVEVKCPNSMTHYGTCIGEPIQRRHYLQMQWQLACSRRLWCDYVSFDPRMPAELRLYIRRVPRDDCLVEKLELEVEAFLREVDLLTVRYIDA